jgi:genome maintenance exonuclease 1
MILLQPKYTYTRLSRDESSGKRLYATPDGHKVPSVTTILDKTKPQEARDALARWKKSVGEKKAQEIVTEAAGRGTRMHKYLEDYVEQGHLSEPGTNPFSQQSHSMARVIVEQGLCNVSEVWGNEVPLYFPELYAGTTDCVGVHNGDQSILDYKQSNKPKKLEWIGDYFLQLTAYALAHNEVHGTNIRKGVIMMCVKPVDDNPPVYQEFILEPKDFDYWTEEWCKRVSQYYKQM